MILEKIDQLLEEVKNISATNADEIEALRLKYLSKKGAITALMNDFRNVPADQKKAVGIKINELKQTAQERINALVNNIMIYASLQQSADTGDSSQMTLWLSGVLLSAAALTVLTRKRKRSAE